MMDYTESICFSAEPAEELNRKAFSLDCRLFMFAYYEMNNCIFFSERENCL